MRLMSLLLEASKEKRKARPSLTVLSVKLRSRVLAKTAVLTASLHCLPEHFAFGHYFFKGVSGPAHFSQGEN